MPSPASLIASRQFVVRSSTPPCPNGGGRRAAPDELPPEQGGETPAAALTAFARSEDRRRALLAGYQSHLAKPVEPDELITVVASLAGKVGRRRS